jgi:hypothetical protein
MMIQLMPSFNSYQVSYPAWYELAPPQVATTQALTWRTTQLVPSLSVAHPLEPSCLIQAWKAVLYPTSFVASLHAIQTGWTLMLVSELRHSASEHDAQIAAPAGGQWGHSDGPFSCPVAAPAARLTADLPGLALVGRDLHKGPVPKGPTVPKGPNSLGSSALLS